MVFQSYALYPHMRCARTSPSGLRRCGAPQGRDRRSASRDAAEILQIGELLERKPGQLSGGQRQRVAIGRAIVREPQHLPVRRAALQPRRRAAHADARRDQQAAPPARRDHDLRHPRPGRGDDAGRPHRRAARRRRSSRSARRSSSTTSPANLFVAGFIGSPRMNFLAGKVSEIGSGTMEIRRDAGASLALPSADAACRAGEAVTFGVRPENLDVVEPDKAHAHRRSADRRASRRRDFPLRGAALRRYPHRRGPGQVAAQPGERVGIAFEPGAHHLFSAAGKVIPQQPDEGLAPYPIREARSG